MKIAWYTPFSANSAIGHFSEMVVDALRQFEVEVQIVRSECRTSEIRSTPPRCPDEKFSWAADFDRSPRNQLSEFDLIVYNIGDHYEYHAYCFTHQAHVPGISILHDYSLHSALNHFCHATAPHHGNYRDHLYAECGVEAEDAYEQSLADGRDADWWQNRVVRYPIYRWALRNTLAVVTHADFYRETVAEHLGCPVTTIPLAYDTPWSELTECAKADEPLTLITVGAVNANKRYESIIRAIGSSPRLRQQVQYRIIGAVNESGKQCVDDALRSVSHPVNVTLTGHVDREQLRAELAAAKVITCLRFPALEGASASVIEALLTGKPVIVSRTGCYEEIPTDLVFHVSPDNEVEQLRNVLHGMLDDYNKAQQVGRRAQEWAQQRHRAESYAEQFLKFAPHALFNQPVLDVADRIGDQLKQWDVGADEVILRRLDQAMAKMFVAGGNAKAA